MFPISRTKEFKFSKYHYNCRCSWIFPTAISATAVLTVCAILENHDGLFCICAMGGPDITSIPETWEFLDPNWGRDIPEIGSRFSNYSFSSII